MTDKKYMRLRSYEGRYDTAYLELQDHPHKPMHGLVTRTVNIHDLIDGYDGPSLVLEFNDSNRPIGIEILYPSQDPDNDEDH
jgi:Protein of unknown function (DUF2283)